MERVKVVLLGAVALGLWVGIARDWMPEAHAQAAASVRCEAWYADISDSPVASDRAVAWAREHAGRIARWLDQQGGQPVFRTTLAHPKPMNSAAAGYIDIVCVR